MERRIAQKRVSLLKEHEGDTLTVIRNPGIIERLLNDVHSYEGFKMYDISTEEDSAAILTRKLRRVKNGRCTIFLTVRDVSILPSIGPFLRTLVRLMKDVDPRQLRVLVDLTFDAKSTSASDDARRYENMAHILVRNSMGAALFLDMTLLSKRSVDLKTRNTTFHLSPLLFHLVRRISSGMPFVSTPKATKVGIPPLASTSKGESATHIVCVEKLPNLYRVLSLFNTYGLLRRLIICTHAKLCDRFRKVAREETRKLSSSVEVCRIIDEIDAADTIENIRKQSVASVVAVDLDPAALVLRYDDCGSDKILRYLRNSVGCVVWGFEKGGIPRSLVSSEDTKIQIDSRSSLNLVAALSIVLHASVDWPRA
eukprot:g2246.t1